jgi:hypothetical protein
MAWIGDMPGDRRSAHRSVAELETDIRKWINEWDKNPKPFVWVKTADAIHETLAAYCGLINDSGHWCPAGEALGSAAEGGMGAGRFSAEDESG